MTHSFSGFTALLALLLGQLVPQAAGEHQTLETCTLIGCFSSAAINVQLVSGEVRKLTLTLDADGELTACTLPEQSVFLPFGAGEPCGHSATISVREAGPGKQEVLLVIHGTPRRITISLSASGHTVAQRTFLPEYVEHSPNGPNCEPHCRSWKSAWRI